MFCHRCGRTNAQGSLFCTACGASLTVQEARQSKPADSKGTPLVIILIGVSILLLTVTLLLVFDMIPPIASTDPYATASDESIVVFLLVADSSAAWYARHSDDLALLVETGYSLTIHDAGSDAETQMVQLEDAVAFGADVIVMEPVLAEACIPALEVARECGIAIVLLGDGSKLQDLSDATIHTDALTIRRLIEWLQTYWH